MGSLREGRLRIDDNIFKGHRSAKQKCLDEWDEQKGIFKIVTKFTEKWQLVTEIVLRDKIW